MDQTPQLADLPEIPQPGAIDQAPPLGPFRTFQTPIRNIAELPLWLVAMDRMPIAASLGAARVGSTWRQLASTECLDLDFDLNDSTQGRHPLREGPSTTITIEPVRPRRLWPSGGKGRRRHQ